MSFRSERKSLDPLRRPIAKAITASTITTAILEWLEQQRAGRSPGPPTPEQMKAWERARPQIAEIILPHLDAYDQRNP